MTERSGDRESEQRVFDLYDDYCHGRIDRRDFLLRAGALTVGGVVLVLDDEHLPSRRARGRGIRARRRPVGGRVARHR
jgi:carboxymethylenebutenolidase